jgi:hypothetical protein
VTIFALFGGVLGDGGEGGGGAVIVTGSPHISELERFATSLTELKVTPQ